MGDKKPTVVAADEFNADADAEQLNEAFKGFGTNESIITSILAGRSLEQRQSIQEAYSSKYEKDLLQDIRSEVSGNYLQALEGLIDDPAAFHAKHVNRIITEILGNDKDIALLEVLFPLNSVERSVVSSTYAELFKTTLLEEVENKVSGNFKEAVVSLLGDDSGTHTARPDETEVYATTLAALTPEDWTTENNQLMEILLNNTLVSLAFTISEYNKKTGKDLLEVVGTEPAEEYREGFKIIVEAAQDHWRYFASQLYKSMKGLGTNDSKLIYIIIYRSEVDLGNIAETFKTMYNCSLQSFICDDTSGDYANLLIALVGPEPETEPEPSSS